MNSARQTRASISDASKNALKAITREQFQASEKFGTMTGDDLYWALNRAATEASSVDDFYNKLVSLIDDRLGSGAYILTLDTSDNGGGGICGYTNPRLPNSVLWGGAAGTLPGVVSKAGVTCFVFWG